MKTNEDNLRQLFEVALDNGWKPRVTGVRSILAFDRIDADLFIYGWNRGSWRWHESLDQIVGRWEPSEISFIEAIAFGMKYEPGEDDPFDRTEPQQIPYSYFRDMWVNHPTSQRLEWLFNTFRHHLRP